MRTLKIGSSNKDVKQVQTILTQQGFFKGPINGVFGKSTKSAVIDFQMSHIDINKNPLLPDGEVGPLTAWALANPSGKTQVSGITAQTSGLSVGRQMLLDVAHNQHALGVKEIPDGSNCGDGVTKYLPNKEPAYWCMYFVTWCHKEAGHKLMNYNSAGHCLTVWKKAQALGLAFKKGYYDPIPGDTFIMLYKSKGGSLSGNGHTGIVSAVDTERQLFNAIEGNAGNRVKQTLRSFDQPTLAGFINCWPSNEQPTNFAQGVSEAVTEEQTT